MIRLLLVLLFLVGCQGYLPVGKLNKNIFQDKIYAEVLVDKQNPRNSVLIQNAINEAIITKFDAKISHDKSNTNMIIDTKNIKFEPISYDENGYIVAYKSIVELEIKYNNKTSINKGTFNFSIEAQSTITEAKKFQAIKEASAKALDSFISSAIIEEL